MDAVDIANELESLRAELEGYVTRLLVRRDLAEEVVQQAAERALKATRRPQNRAELRPWLFRIATNLARDERRRHHWTHERLMQTRAEVDEGFVARCDEARGDPELALVAQEHLAICFSCTAGQLPDRQAAALLLREVHGSSNEEAADVLGARPTQVKAWVQAARAHMSRRYAATCALVNKQGVCHQCVELSDRFLGESRSPLPGGRTDIDARLAVLRGRRDRSAGPWERLWLSLVRRTAGE